MVWFLIAILFIFILLLDWYVKILNKRIEHLNERLEYIHKNFNKTINQINDRFDGLSEHVVSKYSFEKEKIKIEQVRIDLRDFENFYCETLDEQTKDDYMQSVNQRVVLDRDN